MSDDNDNYDNVSGVAGISRFIPFIVLASAVTGFVLIALYAYNTGRQSIKEDDLLVIEADKTPLKEKPEDPGGMQFPNQDRTIFETFSTNHAPAKVERVLPAPEEPMDKNAIVDKAIEEKNEDSTDDDKFSVSENPAPVEVKTVEAVGIDDEKAEIPKKYEAKTNVSVDEVKMIEKPIEKNSVKSGNAKIQLGAFGSETEAKENFVKIQKKFPSLTEQSPIIVRAEVKGKIFYRLRVGGFIDKNNAKSLCKNLSAKNQACILVSE